MLNETIEQLYKKVEALTKIIRAKQDFAKLEPVEDGFFAHETQYLIRIRQQIRDAQLEVNKPASTT